MNGRIVRLTGLLVAGIFAATTAQAQQQEVSLLPSTAARWDAAGFTGWFGGNKSGVAPSWNDWYDVALGAASFGRYVTPHVKVELDVFTTTTGEVSSQELVTVDGQLVPIYTSSVQGFRSSGVGLILHYQFLENAWFHPFVGLGVEAVAERSRREVVPLFLPPRAPGQPPILSYASVSERTDVHVRPIGTMGFKWYVAPRAFIRSDARFSVTSRQIEASTWRFGVGFDF